MKLDIPCGGSRNLQVILWGLSPEDLRWHWALKIWRWPTGETLESVRRAGLLNFGFRALTVGPLEFRYWPNRSGQHPKPDEFEVVKATSQQPSNGREGT